MQITLQKNGTLKLHLFDEDDYNVTNDNGVDIWIPKEDVQKIRELLIRDSMSFLSEALNECDGVYRP